ncbi:MAG: Protein-L-isoaspartate O-methyltransferase [Dehalococcoidia bacterium]|nr:Protein-L-isoaspartate O-methyltransferase [Chloroflexota bacterium]MBT9162670.1 Protein-L-isoaspartate O-methyltransferase [Chloroflexota bacterium]
MRPLGQALPLRILLKVRFSRQLPRRFVELEAITMAQVVSDVIRRYVKQLRGMGAIKTKQVEGAFSRAARHKLLEWLYLKDDEGEFEYAGFRLAKRGFDPHKPDPELLKIIYSDRSLLTSLNPPSSTSQPSLVASMLELLELERGMNVLEIGAGTGYNAALMQEIVGRTGHITTIDIQDDVVERTRRLLKASGYGGIEMIAADGGEGFPENAPYNRIIATVGCPDISFRWVEQLADDGFMLIPLQHGGEGFDPLVHIWKEGERFLGGFVGLSGFMSIQGELAIEQRPSWEELARLRSGEPRAVYPHFGIFREMVESGKSKWHGRFVSFLLFLAIIGDKKPFDFAPPSFWDEEKGVAVAREDGVALYGDESLLDDLKSLSEQWEGLGRPGFSDWRLQFLPRDRVAGIREGERAWVIERKFSREMVRLA